MVKQIAIALGSETNTTFSILEENKVYTSKPYKDLINLKNFNQFKHDIKKKIKGKIIRYIACDLHPDYLSTNLAYELARKNNNIPVIPVQHHYAHIASVIHENNLKQKVIGFAFDGTGHGADGRTWGGEVLICDLNTLQRTYHLQYIPQPGGDKAVTEPWRMAVAYLYSVFQQPVDKILPEFTKRIGLKKIVLIQDMIKKGINCPLTSSMGRLFDAVASLLALCDIAQYPAEGPIKLEQIADSNIRETYHFTLHNDEIILKDMIRKIVKDITDNTGQSIISAKFHNTIAQIIGQTAEILSRKTKIKNIVLSGGCFLNNYLMKRIREYLHKTSLSLFTNIHSSASDINISIGQIILADRIFHDK